MSAGRKQHARVKWPKLTDIYLNNFKLPLCQNGTTAATRDFRATCDDRLLGGRLQTLVERPELDANFYGNDACWLHQ